jgi:Flp pilus assembly pilin Flp
MIKLYTRLNGLLDAVRNDESGQTMAEYAIILSVIVVAILTTLAFLAGGINGTLSSVTNSL